MGLIIVRFNPVRTFRLPRAIRASIGPAPRVVADDIWSKLVWAGLNLQEQDLHYGEQLYYRYPFSMVRALCVLWLFGGYVVMMKFCGCEQAVYAGKMMNIRAALGYVCWMSP
jgi:hypothetical protein